MSGVRCCVVTAEVTIATLCGRNRGQQPLRKRGSRIGTVSLIHITQANNRGHRRPPCPLPGAVSAGWDENITHGLCSEWMLKLRRCPGMVSTTSWGLHVLLLPAVLIFPMTGLAKEGCAAGHTDATGQRTPMPSFHPAQTLEDDEKGQVADCCPRRQSCSVCCLYNSSLSFQANCICCHF